jgi:(R,R)-butanediol dehydrogenase / meso-butanediol dehydrogenase / diacetyl reductase
MLSCTVRGISPVCRACRSGKPGNCENFAKGALAPGMFMGICRDVGGGFAEYVVAHQDQIFPIPRGVSPASATLTEPLAVALQAVLDNRPAVGEKALVIGGGVIGLMIVKVLRALVPDCAITVVEPSPFAGQCAKSAGADVIPEGALNAALRSTGAKAYRSMIGQRILQGGFERVYDTVGHTPTVRAALNAMAALGTLSLVGISDRIAFDPTPLWLKLQTVKGVYGYGYNDTPQGRKHAFEIALELMASGAVQVEDMLTHTFALERYQEMIEVNFTKGRHRAMKTAIRFV